MTRKPECSATNAARQARLRERRKAEGYRRIGIWLSPEQVNALERLGGEIWLGRTCRELLESAIPAPQPLRDNDLSPWAEADSLHSQGLPWATIARRWNAEGRRTVNGEPFRGNNLARDVRAWKAGNGE